MVRLLIYGTVVLFAAAKGAKAAAMKVEVKRAAKGVGSMQFAVVEQGLLLTAAEASKINDATGVELQKLKRISAERHDQYVNQSGV